MRLHPSQLEYQNLKQELERISQVTEFNGKKLLNGQGDKYDFQVGINNDDFQDRIKYDAARSNSSLEGLGISELGVSTKESSQSSLNMIDQAIQCVFEHPGNSCRARSTSRNRRSVSNAPVADHGECSTGRRPGDNFNATGSHNHAARSFATPDCPRHFLQPRCAA